MKFNIFTSQAALTEMTSQRDSLLTKVKDLETEIENLHSMSKDMVEKQAEHNALVDSIKAEYEEKLKINTQLQENAIQTLEIQSLEKEQTVAEKAADLVASLGVAPETVKVSTAELLPMTKESALKKLNSLTGKEQTNFYQAHKDVFWK